MPPGALHVCYCFTPMRYVWDLYDDYFGPRAGWPSRGRCPPSPRGCGAGTGAPRPASTTSWPSRASSPTASAGSTAAPPTSSTRPSTWRRFRIDESPGRLLPGGLGPGAVQARRPGRRRGDPARPPPPGGGLRPGGAPAAGHRRAHRRAARLARRRRGRASSTRGCRALLFPPRRGFRHHAARGDGRGPPRASRWAAAAPRRRWCRRAAPSRPPASSSRGQTVDDLVDAIRPFEADADRFEPKALRRRAEAFDRPLFKERIQRVSDARGSRSAARAEGPLEAARAPDAGRRPRPGRGVLAPRLLSSASTCWARRCRSDSAAVSATC